MLQAGGPLLPHIEETVLKAFYHAIAVQSGVLVKLLNGVVDSKFHLLLQESFFEDEITSKSFWSSMK